jgi:hypothetical protein
MGQATLIRRQLGVAQADMQRITQYRVDLFDKADRQTVLLQRVQQHTLLSAADKAIMTAKLTHDIGM